MQEKYFKRYKISSVLMILESLLILGLVIWFLVILFNNLNIYFLILFVALIIFTITLVISIIKLIKEVILFKRHKKPSFEFYRAARLYLVIFVCAIIYPFSSDYRIGEKLIMLLIGVLVLTIPINYLIAHHKLKRTLKI
ncbi:hypothetical protein BN85403210 [Alteracholeplasma palmae J233]|uniref:Uncharacterized protein n=1 Tax=Alteracholeplasma palmae (strain ATCC 49389 / J233) TaxID=1318466 RepID=U4KK57_ALTPJ|nr:hypothetical protein BN85403210 [Alteracholeplasma palmae J233]